MNIKTRLAAGTAAAKATHVDPPAIEPGGARRMMTVPGQLAALMPELTKSRDDIRVLHSVLDKAKADLAKWDGVSSVRKIDPNLIRRSNWANRSTDEFSTKEFTDLKSEIAIAGGNVQPIKVRVFVGRTPNEAQYETVYGHRRHQACLELGLPVNAIVVEHLTDGELFAEMDRENRVRKNLSPWEQGRMYQKALDGGLYPSLRRLAESLNIGLGNASEVIQLAKLPEGLIDAFPSPLMLQLRWAKPLTDAYQKDPHGVLTRAKEAKEKRGFLEAGAIFNLLIAKEIAPLPLVTVIEIKGKRLASVHLRGKGRVTVEFETGTLSAKKQSGLTELIRGYIETK